MNRHAESEMTLHEAAESEGRSYTTVCNWARKGIKGVFLETIRKGGRIVTTREAIERFYQALTPPKNPAASISPHVMQQLLSEQAASARIAMQAEFGMKF